MMADRKLAKLSRQRRPSGLVTGTVKAALPHGVFVDIGFDHIGHIDPIYIDSTDVYDIGNCITVYVDGFSHASNEYRLRPPGKLTMKEWLERNRERSPSSREIGMSLSLAVQDRLHEPVRWIAEGLEDLAAFAMCLPDNNIMRGVSPYGDTLFNVVQLRLLLRKLDQLQQAIPECMDMLVLIRTAAKEAISLRGYLMFS